MFVSVDTFFRIEDYSRDNVKQSEEGNRPYEKWSFFSRPLK